MARRILKDFRIGEISCVDAPASFHAKALILKRDNMAKSQQPIGKDLSNMSTSELVQQAGKAAEIALDVLAHNLQKRQPHLSKAQAFAKIYQDPSNASLVKAERNANRPAGYSVPVEKSAQRDGRAAESALEALAADLWRREPNLTKEQAYAKVYTAPENRELAKLERAANRPYPPVARTEPVVETSMAFGKLKELAAEHRRANPFLTAEQAFAAVYSDPGNRELVRRERQDSYDRFSN